MISYIIIDDEPIAHRIIEDYANSLGGFRLEKNCYDGIEAIQFLNSNSVDLLFLDLNMPKLKGFDFLKTLSNPPEVIVTTAYSEFAVEGFELNVVDYLLKPFSFERFIKAVNKLKINETPSNHILKHTNQVEEAPKSLFLKGDKKTHRIDLDEILYIEADSNYSKLYLTKKVVLIHEKISSMEEILPSSHFLRIHKSFIIAMDKIDFIDKNKIKIKSYDVPIGQSYRQSVINILNVLK